VIARVRPRALLLPLALIIAAVAAVAALALLAGSSPERAVAIGLYALGAFLGIIGFALGSRNLFRAADHPSADPGGDASRLWETKEAAVVLIVIGIVLLLLGTAVDPNARII
jgi:dipeptide/tripeptide permease